MITRSFAYQFQSLAAESHLQLLVHLIRLDRRDPFFEFILTGFDATTENLQRLKCLNKRNSIVPRNCDLTYTFQSP